MPGMYLSQNISRIYEWTPSNSAIINPCLVKSDQRWLIKFDELRTPVFSSACVDGYTNLSDCIDTTLLSYYIKSKSDLKDVLSDLAYWYKGPYSQPGVRPIKYAFDSGLLAHEYKHYQIDSSFINQVFDTFFLELYNSWVFNTNEYKCESDLLSAKEMSIRVNISSRIDNCFRRYDNMLDWEQKNEELDCDVSARGEYDRIKVRIEKWALNKTW